MCVFVVLSGQIWSPPTKWSPRTEYSLRDSPMYPPSLPLQELGALDPASLQKGGDESDSTTLNAIGRALIQMQQGASSPGGAGSQFIITRATDSDPSQSPNGAHMYMQGNVPTA